MNNEYKKPSVTIDYSEPRPVPFEVKTIDDVQSALQWLGISIKRLVFGGSVEAISGLAGATFPPGWSVSRTGTGVYRIVHNLGTTDYVVTVTATRFVATVVQIVGTIEPKTADYFDVTWSTTGGIAVNTNFDFIVVKNS
jgi:hypothetical protein